MVRQGRFLVFGTECRGFESLQPHQCFSAARRLIGRLCCKMDYMPYTARTAVLLQELAALQPTTLATMHGSSYRGDGAQALRDLAVVMREVYG